MSSSVFANNQGADHLANSAASYAADRLRQALRNHKIRVRRGQFINNDNLSHGSDGPSLIPQKLNHKGQILHFLYPVTFIVAFFLVLSANQIRAEKPGQTPLVRDAVEGDTATKLTSDFRTAVTDKPLRDALESIATGLRVNLWLDRGVDPTTPVSTGANARTGFQAFSSIAQSTGLQVSVVENVVLVGRGNWVEQTAGVALARTSSAALQDITWPDLTTPTQAVIACGINNYTPLPHDLWPAVHWTRIDVSLAHLLVVAQFNLMPSSTAPDDYVPLVGPPKFSALYPRGTHAIALRTAVAKADKQATVKEANSKLLVFGSAAGHLAATNAWLNQANRAVASQLDLDKVRFSLHLENTAAEQAFGQLATTAGLQLVIHPDAGEACKRLVSLDAKDQTLRELCNNIAAAVNVSIILTATTLTINVNNKP